MTALNFGAGKKAFGVDLGTARSGIAVATASAGAVAVESVPMGRNPKPANGQSLVPTGKSEKSPAAMEGQAPLSTGTAIAGPMRFRMPSLVLTRTGADSRVETFVGDDAIDRLDDPRGRAFSSAKSNLGMTIPFLYGLTSGFAKPAAVLVRILDLLFRRAEAHTGAKTRHLPLSIAVPASLPSAARKEILAAAAKAGVTVPNEFLVEEPVAVLLDAIYGPNPLPVPRTVGIYDIGAGTCDVAIFEIQPCPNAEHSIRTLAVGDYDMLGGDNFDLAVAKRVLLPACMPASTPSPLTEPFFIRKNMLAARRLKERLCDAIIDHLRGAGLSASRTHPADYPDLEVVGRTFEVRTQDIVIPAQSIRLTTRDFVDALRPFMSMDPEEGEITEGRWMGSILEPLHFTLGKAGRIATDLDILILSGAACRAPFVPYLLTEYCMRHGLAADRIVYSDLDQAVQRGAAIHALQVSMSGKPPITPVLGADIGLWVYGQRPERLIARGTKLPSAEQLYENIFSVPETNLDAVRVEVYAARRGGKRCVLMSQSIELPPGTTVGEPMTVALSVDAGKVVTLKAFMARHPDRSLRMIGEEMWVTGRDRGESDLLRESRESVRKALATTGMPALEDLLNWATGEYNRRTDASLKTAYEILIGVLDVHPECAEAWNLLGLTCETQNRRLFAEMYFRRAMALSPNSATYRANLGWILREFNRTDEALTVLAAAHAKAPDYAYAAEMYSLALESNGDYERATAVRKETIQLNKSTGAQQPSGDEANWLARLYEGIGDNDNAAKWRQKSAADSRRRSTASNLTAGRACREALLAGPESPRGTSA